MSRGTGPCSFYGQYQARHYKMSGSSCSTAEVSNCKATGMTLRGARRFTSTVLQSSGGLGVLDQHKAEEIPDAHPSWKPRPFRPKRLVELEDHVRKQNVEHLGPTNIMVSDEGDITGTIDWESAGNYPKSWVVEKVMRSAGFNMPSERRIRQGGMRGAIY